MNSEPEELWKEQLLDAWKVTSAEGKVSVTRPPSGMEFKVVKNKVNAPDV